MHRGKPIMIHLPIKKLANFPEETFLGYATDGSAGIELAAAENAVITNETVKVPTGIAVAIPRDWVGKIYIRSGHALKHGMQLVNAVGIIDSDYRGEVLAPLRSCIPDISVHVEKGDRIAQLLIQPCPQLHLKFVSELPETERGEGGFGSTGVK